MYINVYIRSHTCVLTDAYTYMHAYYVHACTHMHIPYMYKYTYTCMHTTPHTLTNTHTHTHRPSYS